MRVRKHAYVVSNIDVDVYADTEQTQHLCTVVKSGTIYYADKKNGSVLHVWFALANGTVMNGYISASVLDGTVIEDITCLNIPNHYEFVKTDNKGNPLPGVRFTLEDADGNILGDYVSDEDGIVRVTDLTPGKYVIREIETLEGFILSGDAIIVEINEKYVVPEEMYTLVNYPEPKTGVILDNPFAWVGFAVIGIALVAGWWFLIHKKYSVNHK